MKLYEERDRAASNSYTLHKFCDVNSLADKGQATDGASLSAEQYARINRDILRGMFKGNVTFKRSASGMTTTCYLQLFGDKLIKAIVSGFGYDVQSEAIRLALVKLATAAENEQNKALAMDLLHGFDDGKEWKSQFDAKGVFAAPIGG